MRASLKLVVLGLTFATPGAWQACAAAEARATINVAATVLPHASIETLDTTSAAVVVTAADVQRGYVDVSRTYRLRSNTQQGLLLQLYPLTGLARQIDVDGFGATVRLAGTDIDIVQPANPALQLRFRLWLQPATAPGEYDLPVQIAATAI